MRPPGPAVAGRGAVRPGVVGLKGEAPRVAWPAGPALAGSWFYRDDDRFHDGYHFWLASETQPQVMRLSCFGVYARWPDLYPPTLDDIAAALGEIEVSVGDRVERSRVDGDSFHDPLPAPRFVTPRAVWADAKSLPRWAWFMSSSRALRLSYETGR